MDDGAPLSTLPLPVVDLSQQAEEGFLGVGHVAVRGPAQELEVTHDELAFLKLQGQEQSQLLPHQIFIKAIDILHTPQITLCLSARGPVSCRASC